MSGPIEEPEYKPYCCGQQSKWICISPMLQYFYCLICKKEVQPNTSSTQTIELPFKDWKD